MTDLILENLPLLATGLLTLLSSILGSKYRKWKDIATTVADAIKDNKITQDEEKEIVKKIKALRD